MSPTELNPRYFAGFLIASAMLFPGNPEGEDGRQQLEYLKKLIQEHQVEPKFFFETLFRSPEGLQVVIEAAAARNPEHENFRLTPGQVQEVLLLYAWHGYHLGPQALGITREELGAMKRSINGE